MAQITVLRPDTPDAPRPRLELAPRGALPRPAGDRPDRQRQAVGPELLEVLADELGKPLHRDITVELIHKPNAAYPITAVQADGMAARAHFVITGRRGLRSLLVVQSARRADDGGARDAGDGADHRAVPDDHRHPRGEARARPDTTRPRCRTRSTVRPTASCAPRGEMVEQVLRASCPRRSHLRFVEA